MYVLSGKKLIEAMESIGEAHSAKAFVEAVSQNTSQHTMDGVEDTLYVADDRQMKALAESLASVGLNTLAVGLYNRSYNSNSSVVSTLLHTLGSDASAADDHTAEGTAFEMC